MKTFLTICLACVCSLAIAGPSLGPADLSLDALPAFSGDASSLTGSTTDWDEVLEIVAALGLLWFTIEDFTQWVNTSAGSPPASGSNPGGGSNPVPDPNPVAVMTIGLAGLCVRRRR